jgi:hypothetical protein
MTLHIDPLHTSKMLAVSANSGDLPCDASVGVRLDRAQR